MATFNEGAIGALVVVAAAAGGMCWGSVSRGAADDMFIRTLQENGTIESPQLKCLKWLDEHKFGDGNAFLMYRDLCGTRPQIGAQ
jgi:hypothetical protein